MITWDEPKRKSNLKKHQIDLADLEGAFDRKARPIDWPSGIVSPGGGVSATLGSLQKARGRNRNPVKEQVAIRLDPEVLAAFRADGPGWQTRVNMALKDWLVEHPPTPRHRVSHADA